MTSGGAGDRLAEAVALMARIRRHGRWEAAQTHTSLLPYLVEETWELVDAVSDGHRDELVSELGDLLLQVLFHASIGAERADEPFDIQDVAGALLDNLRRRAPYWFTDPDPDPADPDAAGPDSAAPDADGPAERAPAAPDAAEQDRLWQEAKEVERAGRSPRGVVEGIPWSMPALALGQKVLARARSARVPEELIPAELLAAPVDVAGSAEAAYRETVRRFAHHLAAAESRLTVPVARASNADWRAVWTS